MSVSEARDFLDTIGLAVTPAANDRYTGSQDRAARFATVATVTAAGNGWRITVTFDGEGMPDTKAYVAPYPYIPAVGDRVLMVPAGRSYVAVGAVDAQARSGVDRGTWTALTMSSGFTSDTPDYPAQALFDPVTRLVHLRGRVKRTTAEFAAGTSYTIATLPSSTYYPAQNLVRPMSGSTTADAATPTTLRTSILRTGAISVYAGTADVRAIWLNGSYPVDAAGAGVSVSYPASYQPTDDLVFPAGKGPVIQSPNGQKWRLGVDDSGATVWTPVS